MAAKYQHFQVEHLSGVTIVTLTAADFFDQIVIADAKRELLAFADTEKPEKLVISFEHVPRFSSGFIGALVSLKEHLRGNQKDALLKLCALRATHREVFRVVDPTQKLFQIYDTVVGAYSSF